MKSITYIIEITNQKKERFCLRGEIHLLAYLLASSPRVN